MGGDKPGGLGSWGEVQGAVAPVSDSDDQPIAQSHQCCSPGVLALSWGEIVQERARWDWAKQLGWMSCSDLAKGLSEPEEKVV